MIRVSRSGCIGRTWGAHPEVFGGGKKNQGEFEVTVNI